MSGVSALRPSLRVKPALLLAVLFVFAMTFVLGEGFKPSRFWSDELGDPRYAKLVPASFGDWVELPGRGTVVIDPVQAEMLDKIYNETLSRVYVNRKTGRAIMLSMAYGKDQSTDTQLHTPEMCYPSQGFRIRSESWHTIAAPGGDMLVKRMRTFIGQREEPLTYFVRTGDFITTKGSLDRNLARLWLAMRGYKVDGLLVRVSEVTRQDDAFDVQDAFLSDLMRALPDSDRFKLIGKLGLSKS